MTKPLLITFLSAVLLLVSSCAHQPEPIEVTPPVSIPPAEQPVPEVVLSQPVEKPKPIKPKTHSLGIIGEVEPVYFLPMKSAFLARIDTGAKGSAIDAENIQEFEREGKKWVSFDLINRQTKETHHFEKRLIGQTTIKRQGEEENRLVVLMTIRIGKEKLATHFSLADRQKFDYQALIGRNILKGRAIVDTALSKTLY